MSEYTLSKKISKIFINIKYSSKVMVLDTSLKMTSYFFKSFLQCINFHKLFGQIEFSLQTNLNFTIIITRSH